MPLIIERHLELVGFIMVGELGNLLKAVKSTAKVTSPPLNILDSSGFGDLMMDWAYMTLVLIKLTV